MQECSQKQTVNDRIGVVLKPKVLTTSISSTSLLQERARNQQFGVVTNSSDLKQDQLIPHTPQDRPPPQHLAQEKFQKNINRNHSTESLQKMKVNNLYKKLKEDNLFKSKLSEAHFTRPAFLRQLNSPSSHPVQFPSSTSYSSSHKEENRNPVSQRDLAKPSYYQKMFLENTLKLDTTEASKVTTAQPPNNREHTSSVMSDFNSLSMPSLSSHTMTHSMMPVFVASPYHQQQHNEIQSSSKFVKEKMSSFQNQNTNQLGQGSAVSQSSVNLIAKDSREGSNIYNNNKKFYQLPDTMFANKTSEIGVQGNSPKSGGTLRRDIIQSDIYNIGSGSQKDLKNSDSIELHAHLGGTSVSSPVLKFPINFSKYKTNASYSQSKNQGGNQNHNNNNNNKLVDGKNKVIKSGFLENTRNNTQFSEVYLDEHDDTAEKHPYKRKQNISKFDNGFEFNNNQKDQQNQSDFFIEEREFLLRQLEQESNQVEKCVFLLKEILNNINSVISSSSGSSNFNNINNINNNPSNQNTNISFQLNKNNNNNNFTNFSNTGQENLKEKINLLLIELNFGENGVGGGGGGDYRNSIQEPNSLIRAQSEESNNFMIDKSQNMQEKFMGNTHIKMRHHYRAKKTKISDLHNSFDNIDRLCSSYEQRKTEEEKCRVSATEKQRFSETNGNTMSINNDLEFNERFSLPHCQDLNYYQDGINIKLEDEFQQTDSIERKLNSQKLPIREQNNIEKQMKAFQDKLCQFLENVKINIKSN